MNVLKNIYQLLVFVLFIWTVSGEIYLEHISSVFIPLSRNPDVFEFNEGVGEQIAVNEDFPFVYTVGGNLVHVLDFTDPSDVSIVYSEQVFADGDGELTDVTICQDWVAVIVDNNTSPLDGRALIYTRYDAMQQPPMTLMFDQIVGAVPDSSQFTPDCHKLIVAIEGEPRVVNDAPVDPEGGAAILDFGGVPNLDNGYKMTFANFTQFDASAEDLIRSGIRKSYNGEGTTQITSTLLSQDLEPENIAINYDSTLAYITLQENNAIAVLDIEAKEFTALYPLGTKHYETGNDWDNRLDASDKDDMINIQNYPIQAFFQPDGAKLVRIDNKEYLISPNEGDMREFTMKDNSLDTDWTEGYRGDDKEFRDMLSPNVSADVRDLLADDASLGRLHFSVTDGLDSNGLVETLYTFGGRSVSLFSVADNFSLVYDTGAELEVIIADQHTDIFNSDAKKAGDTPEEASDSRSDNRGCEPEVVETGSVNGRQLVFTGMERPGFITIHSIGQEEGSSDVTMEFESIYYGSVLGKTWQTMYDDRETIALDPEDMRFIGADKSPNNEPMLIVSGSVSGTISFLKVVVDTDTDMNEGSSGSTIQLSSAVVLMSGLFSFLLSN